MNLKAEFYIPDIKNILVKHLQITGYEPLGDFEIKGSGEEFTVSVSIQRIERTVAQTLAEKRTEHLTTVLDLRKQGVAFEQIARRFGVSSKTIRNWMKEEGKEEPPEVEMVAAAPPHSSNSP